VISENVILLQQETEGMNNLNSGRLLYKRQVNNALPKLIFNLPNPSSRTMALELTQRLTEMNSKRAAGS
jgi:hypothetical protein